MSIQTRLFSGYFALCGLPFMANAPIASAAETNSDNAPAFSPANTSAHCLPAWISPPTNLPANNTLSTADAYSLTQNNNELLTLTDNVSLKQPGLVVFADKIVLNNATEMAKAFGQVSLHQKEVIITGQTATLNQKAQTAELTDTRYQFTSNRSHGSAKHIHLDQANQNANLTQATYTTCPLVNYQWQARSGEIENANKYDWELDFGSLEIDNNKRRIYGYNTVLYFQTIPVFYTPYIDFPMDDRASGLLFPTFGSYRPITKETAESYLAVPYYFNIAPNVDDTLTVMKMQDRGWVLDNEFRYKAKQHSAELNLTGLNDQVTKVEGLGYKDSSGNATFGEKIETRWRAKLNARQAWAKGLTSDILWHEVSDTNFYADIPVQKDLDTVTYTERHVNLNYAKNNFQAGVQLQDYLRLRKDAAYQYEKRPEVTLSYSQVLPWEALDNFQWSLEAEATEFDIAYTNHTKPEGLRTNLSPSLQYLNLKSYGSVKAEVVLNQTDYQLQDTTFNTTGSTTHTLDVPQYALNGQLIFERNLTAFGNPIIQTLEPQIQYLYVPFQAQENIPLFDTADKSLDFSNLFSYNRFSGKDRIGDTNQISAALTSRFLNADGSPLANLGLGQIFYFNDRKVTLNNTAAELAENTTGVSDYFVKVGLDLDHFSFASTSQYSYLNYELTNANSRAKLDLSPRFSLLATHTVSNLNQAGEQEDVATGFTWQINNDWALGTYVNYDFTKELRSEVNHALRYDSCCWASELSVKETQLDNGLYNYSIQFLIEFKGLSSVGTPFKEYLSDKLNF